MKRFGFWTDRLFLIGCAAYLLNRCVLKPHFRNAFLHGYFNDLWLIPCALPLVLWFHRRCHWRADTPPTLWEVGSHLVLWSVLFEWWGPKLIHSTVGDWRDTVCYWIGGLIAWLWWNRETLIAHEL